MKLNDVSEALTRTLSEAGISFRLVPGGKHQRLLFEHGGVRHHMTVPSTPSCRKAPANARACLRRLLRDRGMG